MKLDLDQFWGKQVGVVFSGGHFMTGTLSKDKSEGGEFITLIGLTMYTEFRIALNSIDGIGLFVGTIP